MKNLPASIQARLKNLAKTKGMDFVLMSRLYMQEGVLRRISASRYATSFCLKGGLLLYSISGFSGRPTQDIDLLGRNISIEGDQIRAVLEEALSPQLADGLHFQPESMTIEATTEGAKYPGQRVKVTCTLGSIRTVLKLDIGYGDVVYPEPVQLDYPTLLAAGEFKIYAYSLESVIAEKFEAMIVLDERNSRMKDFFDVHDVITKNDLSKDSLKEAIRRTMQVRDTPTPDEPAIFTEDFAQSSRNLQLWQGFLKRTKVDGPSFTEVMLTIRQYLEPIYTEIRNP